MTWKAADCLTRLNKNTATSLKRAGGLDAVFRYIKNLTKAEVDAIHGAGLGLLLIWETNPTHASYFTHNQGVEDATNAARYAKVLGAPESAVLVHTVDYDAVAGDLAAIDAYVEGVQSVIGDRTGLYGDYRVISHAKQKGSVKFLHQTYGWSYGSKVEGIQAYQHQNAVQLSGIEVDLDELYTSDGVWWPQPELREGSQGGAVEMLQQTLDSQDHTGLVEDGDFGPSTQAAVEQYQKQHGLTADGVVGPQTWAEIDKPTPPSAPLAPPKPNQSKGGNTVTEPVKAPQETIATVESGGFTYPEFIVPSVHDLGAASTEVQDETFGIRVLLAMNASSEQIVHYLVNWYGYSQAVAETEARQNYPVLEQTPGMYKPVKQIIVLHNDNTQQVFTDVKAAFVTYADGTGENIG